MTSLTGGVPDSNMKKAILIPMAIAIFVALHIAITFVASLKESPKYLSGAIKTSPSIIYDNASTQKMMELVKSKSKPSMPNGRIKNILIKKAAINNDIVYKDEFITIEYIKSANSFLTQINNAKVDFSKQKAINYLREVGLSNDAICSLPLIFYLNSDVAKKHGKEFVPIPNFCF